MTRNLSLSALAAASLTAALCAVAAPSFAQAPTDGPLNNQTITRTAFMVPTSKFATMSAYETAKSDKRFSNFVKAVDAAGLRDMLTGSGPLTIIMPTNDAFKRMGVGAWDDLMLPENHEKLVALVKYHILPLKYTGGDLAMLTSGTTVGTNLTASSIKVTTDNGKLKFNGIPASPGVETANSVIYAVDGVLVPPTDAGQPTTTPIPTDTKPVPTVP